MDVKCDKCKTKIKIPDKKLSAIPKGQTFAINCPKCKNKISIENKGAASQKTSSPKPPPQREAPARSPRSTGSSMDTPFDFLEEGAKTALVCEPDLGARNKIVAALENLGFHISIPNAPRDALKQMRFHDFQLVVLNELFGTQDPDMNHVLKYLEQLPMTSRRNMYVAYLNRRFKTMDKMIAFNKSVNMVVNMDGIDDIEKIIQRGLNDNKAFYSIYKESLAKLGKA